MLAVAAVLARFRVIPTCRQPVKRYITVTRVRSGAPVGAEAAQTSLSWCLLLAQLLLQLTVKSCLINT